MPLVEGSQTTILLNQSKALSRSVCFGETKAIFRMQPGMHHREDGIAQRAPLSGEEFNDSRLGGYYGALTGKKISEFLYASPVQGVRGSRWSTDTLESGNLRTEILARVLMKELEHEDAWKRGPQTGLLQNSVDVHGRDGNAGRTEEGDLPALAGRCKEKFAAAIAPFRRANGDRRD